MGWSQRKFTTKNRSRSFRTCGWSLKICFPSATPVTKLLRKARCRVYSEEHMPKPKLTPAAPGAGDLKIEWLEIGRIRPYPNNARVITRAAISKVAASIKQFGWQSPIVVDQDFVII